LRTSVQWEELFYLAAPHTDVNWLEIPKAVLNPRIFSPDRLRILILTFEGGWQKRDGENAQGLVCLRHSRVSEMETPVVFIGHSAEDSEQAKHLEDAIAVSGLLPLREGNLDATGRGWENSIKDGVFRSDVVLLLWSKYAPDSPIVEFESSAALDSGKQIVLCQLDGTPPAPRLSSSKIIPFQDYRKGIPSLLGILSKSEAAIKDSRAVMQTQPPGMARPEAATMATAGVALSEHLTQGQNGSSNSTAAAAALRSSADLTGQQIGERYRVIRLLGRGGMGAVYLVHDNELDRDVALKIIRPEVAEDASALWRFKREIQLSSTITHRNVLRVYDLGESGGVKFLTMQYVTGGDLAGLIKQEGRLPIPRLIHIFRQIGEGLAAAHECGIMHRDLKPSNVMIDSEDGVYLTDFGLAKSIANTGLTQAGFVLGTPHYMSPEQVRGEKADLQSDIYSLGVILYEMATGTLPFGGDTLYEVMMQRTQKPPKPPSEVNPDIPPFLEKVIKRCMAIAKAARYRDIGELLNDLDQGAETGRASVNTRFTFRRTLAWAGSVNWYKAASAALVVVVLALAGWWLWQRNPATTNPAASHKPLSVLIADFKNQTDDPLFSGTLEQTLATGLEGASFITTYNRGSALKTAAELKAGATMLDETLARLVAAREGIDVIVDGSINHESGYQISVSTIDALTGNLIDREKTQASKKEEVLAAMAKLSVRIRRDLGDTTPESVQMAAAETYTTSSLEAAKSYAMAQDLQGMGQWEKAIPLYSRAVELDPNMGRAYAGLAVMYRNLGKSKEAEKYYQLAMARIDRMTERERYRTLGGYFVTIGNQQKAVEQYQQLVSQYPADFVGHSNLALAYFLSRNMPQALAEGRRATEIYPKNVVMRGNLALYAMYAGDYGTAEREAEEILKRDRSYGSVYVCLALSDLAQGKPEQAADVYRQMQRLDPSSASTAAAGLADLALYQGRLKEAVDILQKGIAQDRAAKNAFMAARKETTLAAALLDLGQTPQALAEAEQAIRDSQQGSVLLEAARVFINAKQQDRALKLASELGSRMEVDSRLYAKLIEGECQVSKFNIWDAIRTFHDAEKLSDAWLARFDMGRAYLEASAFTEAYSEFDQCARRKGEAGAIFLDDIPTLHYLPALYYYLGRAQQGLGSPAAADSFQTFLRIKHDGTTDAMITDAQRRLAGF
jgi:serine/threonine protein kinase/tetratricopeptide (TPR) repeat protein